MACLCGCTCVFEHAREHACACAYVSVTVYGRVVAGKFVQAKNWQQLWHEPDAELTFSDVESVGSSVGEEALPEQDMHGVPWLVHHVSNGPLSPVESAEQEDPPFASWRTVLMHPSLSPD